MKFRVPLPGTSRFPLRETPWDATMRPEDTQRYCRRMEALGFDAIYISEHVATAVDQIPGLGPCWSDALTAMAFVAGATERIRVDANVIILPLHHPVAYAKSIATLDQMSGGRVNVSFGVGNSPVEAAALGIDFHRRGRYADEMIELMRHLWSVDVADFRGEFFTVRDVVCEPKPVQKPHPPFWIGGNSKAALRRALRIGEGWMPWKYDAEGLATWMAKAREMPEWMARSRPLELCASAVKMQMDDQHRPTGSPRNASAQELTDSIGHLAEVGVTWTMIASHGSRSLDEYLEQQQRIAEDVMSKCR